MDLSRYALKSISDAVIGTNSVIIIIFLSVILYSKNKKIGLMQKMIMGEYEYSPIELTLSQIVLGVIYGTVGSLILTYSGVAFYGNSGIWVLFIISILLMFYNPRLFCFSYSASILGFMSLFIKYVYKDYSGSIMNTDIASLITFVGIMHILEVFLVMFDGEKGAIPVFTNKDGVIAGGFSLRRYWPMPIVLILVLGTTDDMSLVLTSYPSWWPLIKNTTMYSLITTASIQMVSLYGVVGYSSYTFTMNKKDKTRLSGLCILIYGIAITLLAQIADNNIFSKIFILILTPLAHEFMIYVQRIIESKRKNIYISDEGICVLDVMRRSPAEKIGIKSGDKILFMNSEKIEDEKMLFAKLRQSRESVNFDIKGVDGNIRNVVYEPQKIGRLGIVVVPKAINKGNIIGVNKNSFKDVLDKMKKENH